MNIIRVFYFVAELLFLGNQCFNSKEKPHNPYIQFKQKKSSTDMYNVLVYLCNKEERWWDIRDAGVTMRLSTSYNSGAWRKEIGLFDHFWILYCPNIPLKRIRILNFEEFLLLEKPLSKSDKKMKGLQKIIF